MLLYVPSIIKYYAGSSGNTEVLGVFTSEKDSIEKLINTLFINEMICSCEHKDLDSDIEHRDYCLPTMIGNIFTFSQLLEELGGLDETSYYNDSWHIQMDIFNN